MMMLNESPYRPKERTVLERLQELENNLDSVLKSQAETNERILSRLDRIEEVLGMGIGVQVLDD